MAHPPARLTPFRRLLLVQRVAELGWSVARAAEATGVFRTVRTMSPGMRGATVRPIQPRLPCWSRLAGCCIPRLARPAGACDLRSLLY